MAYFDLPYDQLQTYKPDPQTPADFDGFWQETLASTRQFPLDARFEPVDYGMRAFDTFDVTFNGYGGQPIKGWFLLPRQRTGQIPCVVEFIGYGGGRGFPTDWLLWASAGYAHLIMDTRGQGSNWRRGDTPDIEIDGSNPQYPGFMTKGVLSPKTYYYRRVFTDGVRAVEAALSHPAVDPERIAVTGGSQGGGISIAVAGLEPRVKVTMPDVPFLCHFQRATLITDSHPYQEIVVFCKSQRDRIETVFNTLKYFDGISFASRSNAQALFSVSLMDDVCPPSTVFAAYNHFAGEKQIKVWQFNKHEGGEGFQALEKVRYLGGIWPV